MKADCYFKLKYKCKGNLKENFMSQTASKAKHEQNKSSMIHGL